MDENPGSTTTPPAPPAPPMNDGFGPASDTSKLLAAIGYIFGVVAIVALLIEPYKNEQFVKLHAVQALALWLIGAVAGMVPIIGWVVSIAAFVVMVIGLIKAFQGEYWKMPLIYDVVKSFVE